MRTERVAQTEQETATIGPGTLILAAVGCFAIGFAALMIVPRIWPRYVQTQAAADIEPIRPIEAGIETPKQISAVAAPGVVTEIKATGSVTEPQRIASYGGLAGLAGCKAAIRSGGTYEKVGPEQMAAFFGTRGKPLTSAQIDAGCRRLTE